MMTEIFVAVTPPQIAKERAATAAIEVPDNREVDESEVARELVRQARVAGVALTGPNELLKAITKTVIETRSTKNFQRIWAMTSMTVRDIKAATPATAPGPRPC